MPPCCGPAQLLPDPLAPWLTSPPFRRDITAGKVGFEELEKQALAEPDPWAAGLPSGSAELSEIVLSRYVR